MNVEEVKKALEDVRPSLQADGGDIEIVDIQDQVLTINYEGACVSCSSAQFGTLEAIRSIIRDEYSAEMEVVAL